MKIRYLLFNLYIDKIKLRNNILLVSGRIFYNSDFGEYYLYNTFKNYQNFFALSLDKSSLLQVMPAISIMQFQYLDIVGPSKEQFLVAGYTNSEFSFTMGNKIHGLSDGFVLLINPASQLYSGVYIGGNSPLSMGGICF